MSNFFPALWTCGWLHSRRNKKTTHSRDLQRMLCSIFLFTSHIFGANYTYIYIYTYISVSILILVGNLQCVTGWFSLIVLDILRLRVAVRFLSIYPNPGAKPFLKSKSSRFEKLKRMYLFPEEFKQKGQQVEKG